MSRNLFQSMRHAIRGIMYALKRERNIRLQFSIAVVVMFFAFLFQLSLVEWSIVFLSIMFVIVLEMINSAIEASVDVLKPRLSGQVKIIKDMMAGAVLMTSICTAIVGILIFLPHMFELLFK